MFKLLLLTTALEKIAILLQDKLEKISLSEEVKSSDLVIIKDKRIYSDISGVLYDQAKQFINHKKFLKATEETSKAIMETDVLPIIARIPIEYSTVRKNCISEYEACKKYLNIVKGLDIHEMYIKTYMIIYINEMFNNDVRKVRNFFESAITKVLDR